MSTTEIPRDPFEIRTIMFLHIRSPYICYTRRYGGFRSEIFIDDWQHPRYRFSFFGFRVQRPMFNGSKRRKKKENWRAPIVQFISFNSTFRFSPLGISKISKITHGPRSPSSAEVSLAGGIYGEDGSIERDPEIDADSCIMHRSFFPSGSATRHDQLYPEWIAPSPIMGTNECPSLWFTALGRCPAAARFKKILLRWPSRRARPITPMNPLTSARKENRCR